MSILVNKDTRVVIQGITGEYGSQHARACIAYGTKVVAGVTPGRSGQKFGDTVPMFDTVEQAVRNEGADVSCIFVPPVGAADANGTRTVDVLVPEKAAAQTASDAAAGRLAIVLVPRS